MRLNIEQECRKSISFIIFIFVTLNAFAEGPKFMTTVSVLCDKFGTKDSILVTLFQNGAGFSSRQFQKTISVNAKNGIAQAVIEDGHVSEGVQIEINILTLNKLNRPNKFVFNVYNGSHVSLSYINGSLQFAGVDSAFFTLQLKLMQIEQTGIKENVGALEYLVRNDSVFTSQLQLIEKWDLNNYDAKILMTQDVILTRKAQLKIEAAASYEKRKWYFISYAMRYGDRQSVKEAWLVYRERKTSEQMMVDSLEKHHLLQLSGSFPFIYLNRFFVDSCIVTTGAIDRRKAAIYLDKTMSGCLRDLCFIELMERFEIVGLHLGDEMADISSIIKRRPPCKDHDLQVNIILQRIKGQTVFQNFYENTEGEQRYLPMFRGKIRIVVAWFAGCRPCTELLPKLDSLGSVLGKENIQFISLSDDKDRSLWKYTLDKLVLSKASWEHLITANTGIELPFNQYWNTADPFIQFYNIRGFPYVLIVDKEGRVSDQIAPFVNQVNECVERVANKVKPIL